MERASRCVTEEPNISVIGFKRYLIGDILSFLGWWKVGFCLCVHSKRINLAYT